MAADVFQVRDLARDLDVAGARVAAGVVKIVTEVAHVVADTDRQDAPVRTGALRRSINVTVLGSGGIAGVQATVRVDEFYGRFVNFGTKKMDAHNFTKRGAKIGENLLQQRLDHAVATALW